MSDQDGDNKMGGRGRGGPGRGGSVRQSFSHGRSKAVVVEKKRKRIIPPGAAAGGAAAAAAAAMASKGQSGAATVAPPQEVAEVSAPVETKAPEPQAEPAPAKPVAAAAPAPAPKAPAERANVRAPAKSAPKTGGRPGAGISREEAARRLAAIRQHQRDEEERKRREAEDEKRRAEEAKRRAAEAAAQARAEQEERKRREAEEERRTAQEAQAAEAPVEAPAALPEAALTEESRPRSRPQEDARGPSRAAPAPKKPAPSRGRDDGRRRSGKLTISQALNDGDGGRQRSLAAMRRRQEREKRKMMGPVEREKVVRDVVVPEGITVQELANRMAERVADVIKSLMASGVMATQNQTIDQDTAELIVEEFGHKIRRVSEADVEDAIETTQDAEEDQKPRAPVVTIMGHVDHGKTSILDALRKTNVVSGEAGGITQHIGAYQITTDGGQKITFLDTPGHAAFTSMRARGANVTDIVILVVAADDSVMPQTIEAINHAKAAAVPMIVAINKIDREGSDPNKVRTELLQHEVIVEEMSGDVLDVEVSAITGQGLDTLVENIVLQSELLEIKANPDRPAEGAVIEAKLDTGRGPVATVLVQRGTLKRGDIFVVGEQWGRVRALMNDQGERVDEAGPSVPVEVLGLQGTPEAGDVLNVVEDENKAREIADYRQRSAREKQAAQGARATLDQLLAQAQSNANVAELPLLMKADVQGSSEAIVQALEKVGNDEVRVRVLHSGVGAITESDVTLAEASNAPIIGFNVRANAPAREAANQKGVEIRYYSIIYDLVDDVKQAASGLLSAEVKETFIGYAEIKQVFKVTGVGKVAGCMVTEGVARRSAGVRLLRDNVVIHEGTLKTLKRFKDEVREVQVSQECGMAFENYDDIREGDVIEIFEREEIERNLD
ncbi:MAG: translation initiation factor IF-2 [Pseudomonadota bacterium]